MTENSTHSTALVSRLIQTGIPIPYATREMGRRYGDVRETPCTTFEGTRPVAMLFTSRSGTTFFVDALNKSKLFGTIHEHFNPYRLDFGYRKWKTRSAEEYVRECVRRFSSPDGVFGFKGTVEALLPLVQINELPINVSNWSWITVRREDAVAQAISLLRAKKSSVWHDRGQLEEPPPVPDYDFETIEKQLTLIQRKQGQIERFFATFGIEPLRLVYEEFQDDPLPALRAVYDHMGLTTPPGLADIVENSKFQVLRNAETEAMRQRFLDELGERLRT